jgi:hypothetical protein
MGSRGRARLIGAVLTAAAVVVLAACSAKAEKAVRPIAAAQDVVEVGTPQMYGQWQWAVLCVSREKSISDGGQQLRPSGVYLLVEISLTNLAIKPASFDDYVFFRVQDGQHRAYLMDKAAGEAAARAKGFPPHGADVPAGGTLHTVIAFDIPTDAQDLVLSEETRGEGPVRLGR